MKSRLALCHLSVHDDVRSLISETRSEAMKLLGKLQNETPTSTAEERLLTIAAKVGCRVLTFTAYHFSINGFLYEFTVAVCLCVS